MACGAWRVARGAWRVARGAWRVARGAWRVVRGAWRVARGAWRVARGVWRVACGAWRVARGAWRVCVWRVCVGACVRVCVCVSVCVCVCVCVYACMQHFLAAYVHNIENSSVTQPRINQKYESIFKTFSLSVLNNMTGYKTRTKRSGGSLAGAYGSNCLLTLKVRLITLTNRAYSVNNML